MKGAIFWDIKPCSPYVERRFIAMYHLQGSKVSQARNQHLPSHLLTSDLLCELPSTRYLLVLAFNLPQKIPRFYKCVLEHAAQLHCTEVHGL
jgi:hypothetical protein